MKKNTGLGLAVLAVVMVVAVVLWRLYLGGPATVGPVATSKPVVAPPAAVTPPAPLPEAKHPEPPVPPPTKEEPSPAGIAPLQEPSPPATQITIPPEMKEHYGILAGSYRTYADAAKLLATLKKQGKPAFVQRDPRDLNLFQVWLGPFSSHTEAQAAEKEMHAKLKKPLKIEHIENPVPK